MLLLCLKRSYQIIFHVVIIYILQAVYTAIDTDQLVKKIDMLLSVIKATEPNIKNRRMSCPWTIILQVV